MVRKNIPVNSKGKDLSTVGGRIASERARLQKTVVDFAVLCGVTKQTQIKYENGSNFPDTRYLERADHLGADILYMLTGSRSYEAISHEEQNLLDAYNSSSESIKQAVFGVLLASYSKDAEAAKVQPGYFMHEIKGEEDVRYEKHGADYQPGVITREYSHTYEIQDSDSCEDVQNIVATGIRVDIKDCDGVVIGTENIPYNSDAFVKKNN